MSRARIEDVLAAAHRLAAAFGVPQGGCGCCISGASSSAPRGPGYAMLIALGIIVLSARRRRRR